jgi:nucleoside-diphosphate-sugar epimerase
MRVVITGGAGFLGYHLAPLCAANGATPVIVDVARADPADYPPGTELHVGDVRDPGVVARVLRGGGSTSAGDAVGRADVVVHAAAALPLWAPADIRSTNVTGTRTVLHEARAAGVPRVVFVSSTAVYGVPEKHPLEEDDPLVGVGPYGESKIAAERICTEYRARGYCVPVLRPKTFLGTGRLGVFQILYDWVRDGKRIPVLGSGRNRYQLLEVDDLCAAIWAAATAPPALANSTFNVGATRFESVAADVGALCAHAGSGARPFPVPAAPAKLALRALEAVHLSPLYRWVYGTADKDSYVTTDRLQKVLGWRPRYSNAEALIRAYDWYLANREGLAAAGGGAESTGVTHRVAWDQGALKVLKRWL